jgi:hypothetical protein
VRHAAFTDENPWGRIQVDGVESRLGLGEIMPSPASAFQTI